MPAVSEIVAAKSSTWRIGAKGLRNGATDPLISCCSMTREGEGWRWDVEMSSEGESPHGQKPSLSAVPGCSLLRAFAGRKAHRTAKDSPCRETQLYWMIRPGCPSRWSGREGCSDPVPFWTAVVFSPAGSAGHEGWWVGNPPLDQRGGRRPSHPPHELELGVDWPITSSASAAAANA